MGLIQSRFIRSRFVFPAPYVVGGAAVTSLAVQATATSANSATITGPATIIAGDLLVLSDYQTDGDFDETPVAAVPSGFTIAQNTTLSPVRHILSYGIADGSEASAALTGMDHADGVAGAKALYVFRPNNPITTAAHFSGGAQMTSGNPAAQSVTASGGTPPLVVIGAYGSQSIGGIDPRTFSPAKDGELASDGNFNLKTYLAYKIYNSSPADTSIDMDDELSFNSVLSCYIQVS